MMSNCKSGLTGNVGGPLFGRAKLLRLRELDEQIKTKLRVALSRAGLSDEASRGLSAYLRLAWDRSPEAPEAMQGSVSIAINNALAFLSRTEEKRETEQHCGSGHGDRPI